MSGEQAKIDQVRWGVAIAVVIGITSCVLIQLEMEERRRMSARIGALEYEISMCRQTGGEAEGR